MAAHSSQESLETLKLILDRISKKGTYFELLGVELGADEEQVRAAFLKLARVLHPDLAVFRESAFREDATRAFGVVSGAHKILTDAVLRQQYFSDLGMRDPKSIHKTDGGDEFNPDLARIHVHRARQLLVRKDWAGAEEGLSFASQLFGDKEHDDCKVMLGWAIMNNTANSEAKRSKRSRELWMEVLGDKRKRPARSQANYYMAIWSKFNGEVPKVKTYLDRCLREDPKHVEAQRELRLFERRRSGRSGTHKKAIGGSSRGSQERRKSRGDILKAVVEADERPPKVGLDQKKKKKKSWLEKLLGK